MYHCETSRISLSESQTLQIKIVMKRIIYTLVILFSFNINAKSQGCIHKHDRDILNEEITQNRAALIKSGKLSSTRSLSQPVLKWPLKQAKGYSDPSYYAITNYVDIDPDTLSFKDYNCGARTYEGHRGIDIAIGPFDWNKIENNEVEAIAAADGVLLKKHDGEFDQQCSVNSSAKWNVVVIEHSDGSQTWYGHLKSGTVTTKDSGDVVLVGEVLGIVASSGKSTGPHLHFEVHDSNGNVVEPFDGTCSTLVDPWWEDQLPYYDSGINKLMTSSQQYTLNSCPNLDDIYEEEAYSQGDSIFFSLHYRNSLKPDTTTVRAIEPDGGISSFLNVEYVRNGNYHKNFHDAKWNKKIPDNAEKGKWKFKATYNTSTYGILNYQKFFWVKETCVYDRNIEGTHNVDRYYPASNSIISTSTVSVGNHVVYNAESFTELKPGFHAVVGSKIEIKTDGCN